jgi:DNA repair protein RecN (Recombination protein N)
MLTHLTIKNYALIEHLELDFSRNLNVITGETGAGKSILLGAIGLLLGNRADSKVLWNAEEKCVAEATFEIGNYHLQSFFEEAELDYADQTMIRREVSANGKSRAFVNDTPVTLDIMKQLGSRLMDIHSQHETLNLGDRDFQLRLIDTFAGNGRVKEVYQQQWKTTSQLRKQFEQLQAEATAIREEADFVKFQLDELTKAGLKETEQEELESQVSVLEHAGDIKSRFLMIESLLSEGEFTIDKSLHEVRSQLQAIASFVPSYKTLFERVDSIRIELNDIRQEIDRESEAIEVNPDQLQKLQDRLSLIYHLQQKHRKKTIAELLEIQRALEEKATKSTHLDDELASLERQIVEAERLLMEKATLLSQSRSKVLAGLCKKLAELASDLGMPDALLKSEMASVVPGPSGIDLIDLLFSANKGIAPKPLQQVASGGEFSRLMFCVKYVLAEKMSLPTLLLDEIDNGISGEVAIQMARLMQTMAQQHQLIVITHLPQIAAKGHSHYFVFKETIAKKTVSKIRLLNPEQRIEEIAKMIAGENPSTRALASARELMNA